MTRDLSDSSRQAIDFGAWAFAGLGALSFWQNFALGVTILASLASLILACIRIYDRVRFGRMQ